MPKESKELRSEKSSKDSSKKEVDATSSEREDAKAIAEKIFGKLKK